MRWIEIARVFLKLMVALLQLLEIIVKSFRSITFRPHLREVIFTSL
jgi:type I toxin-antitoxin system toxin TisB